MYLQHYLVWILERLPNRSIERNLYHPEPNFKVLSLGALLYFYEGTQEKVWYKLRKILTRLPWIFSCFQCGTSYLLGCSNPWPKTTVISFGKHKPCLPKMDGSVFARVFFRLWLNEPIFLRWFSLSAFISLQTLGLCFFSGLSKPFRILLFQHRNPC